MLKFGQQYINVCEQFKSIILDVEKARLEKEGMEFDDEDDEYEGDYEDTEEDEE